MDEDLSNEAFVLEYYSRGMGPTSVDTSYPIYL
jgi:hypothetical protein